MKRLLLILLMLLQFVTIFSRDIIATGYGASPEEAKENAITELSTSISANISSITTLSLMDTSSESIFDLSQKANVTTNTELYGIVLGMPQFISEENYSVSAVIPENTASYYQFQINELEKNILIADLQYSSGNMITDFEYFKAIYDSMNCYDAYSYILSVLTDGEWCSDVSFPVSKTEIKMKYTAIISSYIDALSDAIEGIELAKMRRVLTKQEQQFLDRSSEKIQQIKDEYKASIDERNNHINEIKSNLSDQQQDYINRLLQIDMKNRNESRDLSAHKAYLLLKDIQTYYEEIITMMNSTLSDIEKQFLNDRLAICNDEYKKDYLPIECTKGIPNDEAIKARINKVSRIVEDYRQAYAHNSIEFLEETFDSLNARRTDFIEILQSCSNRNYTNNNVTGDLYVHIDRFSQSDNKWHGKVSGTILGEPIVYDFDFSYEEWTGKTPATISDTKYEEFMLDVQYLNDILTQIGFSCIIEISYNIQVDWSHSIYYILIDKMAIKDPIADRLIKECSISEKILATDFSFIFTPFTAFNTLISIKELIPEEYAGIKLYNSVAKGQTHQEPVQNAISESDSIAQQWIDDSINSKGHGKVETRQSTNNILSLNFVTTGEISLQNKLELFETLFLEYQIAYSSFNLHTMLGLGFNIGLDSAMIEQVYTALGVKFQARYIDCYMVMTLGGLLDESLYEISPFIVIPYIAVGKMWPVSSNFNVGIFGKFGYEISDRKNNTEKNKYKYGLSIEASYEF